MIYYFIRRPEKYDYESLGTSRLGFNKDNPGASFNDNEFWEITNPINLTIYAIDRETKFYFPKFEKSGTGYIYLMYLRNPPP
jgi:hypothetical protein